MKMKWEKVKRKYKYVKHNVQKQMVMGELKA